MPEAEKAQSDSFRVPAEIAQRHVKTPDGDESECFVVTAIEPEGKATAIFSGYGANERATEFARERYAPVHFRLLAETGHFGLKGKESNGGLN